MIEYKRRDAMPNALDSWVLVNNNVKPEAIRERGGTFLILDLSPETRYTLRITAHNAADSTVKEYNFTTLTFTGGKRKLEYLDFQTYERC